jgi:tRNA pseudouridine38-40 synthase
LSRLFSEPLKVTAAGRTDSGVHASGQVVSFSTPRQFPGDRLEPALNAILPPDCSVRDVAEVDDRFSARFSALERTYIYSVLNRPQRGALFARYAHHVARPLDLERMRSASRHLVGQHDFRSFCVSPSATTVRTVKRLEVGRSGDLVRIAISADGFLHHMVRIIVGTLVECGTGRREPDEVAGVLRSGDRPASVTAPAQGLCLAGVRYEDYDSFAEPPLYRRAPALLDGDGAFP